MSAENDRSISSKHDDSLDDDWEYTGKDISPKGRLHGKKKNKTDKTGKKKDLKKEIFEYVKFILIGGLIAFLLCRFVIINAVVPTRSMVPTINAGERLIGLRIPYYFTDPKRGDIVIFKSPEAAGESGQLFIKRVIGLPGETIRIVAGVAYLVNDDDTMTLIDNSEWWYEQPNAGYQNNYQEITLGSDEYFMMGDNRNGSSDSRDWGPVKRKAILAKAWLKYYKGFKILK